MSFHWMLAVVDLFRAPYTDVLVVDFITVSVHYFRDYYERMEDLNIYLYRVDDSFKC